MGNCNAEMFHKIMSKALDGIPGVAVFMDSVLIHTPSVQEHNTHLSLC